MSHMHISAALCIPECFASLTQINLIERENGINLRDQKYWRLGGNEIYQHSLHSNQKQNTEKNMYLHKYVHHIYIYKKYGII